MSNQHLGLTSVHTKTTACTRSNRAQAAYSTASDKRPLIKPHPVGKLPIRHHLQGRLRGDYAETHPLATRSVGCGNLVLGDGLSGEACVEHQDEARGDVHALADGRLVHRDRTGEVARADHCSRVWNLTGGRGALRRGRGGKDV